MSIPKSTLFMFVIAAIVALYLYYDSGTMLEGGMHGRMNGISWLGGISWMWFLTIITLIFGAAFSWLLFRKKN